MTLINTIVRKISFLGLAIALFTPLSYTFGQVSEVEAKVVVSSPKLKYKVKSEVQGISSGDDTFAERSLTADPKVNIYICVAKGNLKITGWERNEIRVFISDGTQIGFKIQQKSKQNIPNLLTITGFNPKKNIEETFQQECLSGRDIELDVPRGAFVNVKGRSSETTIEGIRKTVVKNVGGGITLSNIEQGINASTYEGDVMVENSGGAIVLETTNGNIMALDVAPSEIGDIFRAKTSSGTIAIQQIEHRQNEFISNSGSIKFIGGFQNGGQYDFRTQNGTISLAIPEKSSCKINASYGFGSFDYELKLDDIVKNNSSSRTQSLTALMGSGEATVNLTTASGSIRLKKQ